MICDLDAASASERWLINGGSVDLIVKSTLVLSVGASLLPNKLTFNGIVLISLLVYCFTLESSCFNRMDGNIGSVSDRF